MGHCAASDRRLRRHVDALRSAEAVKPCAMKLLFGGLSSLRESSNIRAGNRIKFREGI
jgi:hypothetical protein